VKWSDSAGNGLRCSRRTRAGLAEEVGWQHAQQFFALRENGHRGFQNATVVFGVASAVTSMAGEESVMIGGYSPAIFFQLASAFVVKLGSSLIQSLSALP